MEVQFHVFHLSSKVDWSVSFTSQPLYPRLMSPQCSFYRKVGVIHSQSTRLDEEENLSSLPSVEH